MSSARNAIAASLMVVLCGLAIYGRFTSFYLSQQWLETSFPVAFVVSVLPVIWIIRAIKRHQLGYPRIRSPAVRMAIAAVVVPLAVISTCWVILVIVLPDVFTRVAGKPFTETHDLRTQQVTAYKDCKYRVIGPPFGKGGKNPYYCASPSEFASLPKRGIMRVRGRASWLGRHIDRVESFNP